MKGKTTNGDPVNLKIHPVVLGIIFTGLLAFMGWAGSMIYLMAQTSAGVADIKEQQANSIAYINAETNRVNFMIGMMSRDQQSQLMQFDLTHPMPKLTPDRKRQPKENQ